MAIGMIAVFLWPAATAESQSLTTTTPAPTKALIARKLVRPKPVVTHHKTFTPWSRPSVGQVRKIIAYEADRWHVSRSHLDARVFCESGYRWWAKNGQYAGLGQFAAETFGRGMASIGSRTVKIVRTGSRLVREHELRTYSDGSRVRARRGLARQTVRTVLVGHIPAAADRLHGWAQVRIMARAMAGLGGVRDSEWECR
jgi:hypothetical protein